MLALLRKESQRPGLLAGDMVVVMIGVGADRRLFWRHRS
jgi:hypothetical protein